jgi:sialate O-acetylesterase
MKAWEAAAQKAREEDKAPPPRPVPAVPEPKEPERPEGDRNKLANVFNSKLYPLIPYAIKGAAWYQGESNSDNARQYRALFPLMIEDWRARWGEGDFPFVYVQLPNLGVVPTKPDPDAPPKPGQGGDFCGVREAQIMTLSLPNTGEAITVDIGDPHNVHPKDKADVGYRLALVARKVAYGEDIVYTGPTFDSMKVDGNKARITFNNVGSGLTIGVPPWTPSGKIPALASELRCFTIAGSDRKWAWAKAVIDGNQVIASSDEVPNPVAVRYDWFNSPFGNLYNKEKLPAAPFRTDNWEQ